MLETQLLEMLESTITVTPVVSRRKDLAPTYGTPVNVRAHLQGKRVSMRSVDGENVFADGIAHLDDVYAWITTDCKLQLPTGVAQIVAVDTRYGPNMQTGKFGPYQTVLFYGVR